MTPTPKQLNFLEALHKERHLPMPTVTDKLQASKLIDQLLKTPAPKAPKPAPAPKPVVECGFYVDNLNQVFKVQFNQAKTNRYAKKLTQVFGSDDWKWDYLSGLYDYVGKGLASGTIVPLTIEKAKELGHMYGNCMICGHKLTKEESIFAGIGPVCAKKL